MITNVPTRDRWGEYMEMSVRTTVTVLCMLSFCSPLQLAAQTPNAVSSPKIRVVDGTNYPRTSQGIQSAIKDIGMSPGTVYLTPGIYDISSEIQVTAPGIRIIGDGVASTMLNVANPTANLFNITGSRFELMDLGIKSTSQKTAGSLVVMGGPEGHVHNVRIEGNFWNGFTAESGAGGSWSLDTIRVIGKATWNYFLRLQSPTRTIASTHVHNLYVSNAITWKTASIILDTGVDTFICSDSELGPILAQDSLKTQAPRWIDFTNTFVEGGNAGQNDKTALDIAAVRDLRYVGGYIASSRLGAVIGPGARGVEIASTEFVSVGRSAVTIAAGARDVSIVNNTFEDTGVEANGAFDTVAVAPGTSDFDISHNMFKSAASNRPRYNLSLPAKCATCIADGNRFGGYATDAMTGGK